MKNSGGSKLGGVMYRSTLERQFTWTPPDRALSGAIIPFNSLNITVRSGPRNPVFEPTDRILWAGDVEGGEVAFKVTLPGFGKFGDGSKTARVKVGRRDRGELTWRLPTYWDLGEALDAKAVRAREQHADFGPPDWRVVAPPGGIFADAGKDQQVTLEVTRDDYYVAKTISGIVEVVDDLTGEARDTALQDVDSGGCWNGPTTRARRKAVANFNGNVGRIKDKATEIMNTLPGMSAEQLTSYLDGQISDANNPDYKDVRPDQVIWNVHRNLQVRYKPNGDDRRGPCFCIEVKTIPVISRNEESVACKIQRNGYPGPKGPNDTVPPNWIGDCSATVFDTYMDTVCDQTHIAL